MKKAEILMFYEMFDDDDISTERLLAMTADAAGCDIDDVVSALADEYAPDDVKCTAIFNDFTGHYYVDDVYGIQKQEVS